MAATLFDRAMARQTDLLANFLLVMREVFALLLQTGHLLVHADDDLANRAAAPQQNMFTIKYVG